MSERATYSIRPPRTAASSAEQSGIGGREGTHRRIPTGPASPRSGFGHQIDRIHIHARADPEVVHRGIEDYLPGVGDIFPGGAAPFLGNPTPDLGIQMPSWMPNIGQIPGMPDLPGPMMGNPTPDLSGLKMPDLGGLPNIDPSLLYM